MTEIRQDRLDSLLRHRSLALVNRAVPEAAHDLHLAIVSNLAVGRKSGHRTGMAEVLAVRPPLLGSMTDLLTVDGQRLPEAVRI